MADEPVYEMLWDCRFCGSKKLLGLTHRFCPSCGGPQNADERYFPSDAEKVLAGDHLYAGVDHVCRHCGQATGRSAKHCAGCGAPFDGARDAATRVEATHARATGLASGPAPGGKRALKIGCAAVLAVVAVIAVLFSWKKEGVLEVTAQTWKREIAIESFGPVRDSAWCDRVPAGARVLSRSREVRERERVQDGEECRVDKVDRGNGTFVEKQSCTPKYREEPVYDDKCSFETNRWKTTRTATASGASVASPPVWPAVQLARPGECVGCEREGSRRESYELELRDEKGGMHSCDLGAAEWAAFAVGSRWKGRLTVVGSAVDCSSLAPR